MPPSTSDPDRRRGLSTKPRRTLSERARLGAALGLGAACLGGLLLLGVWRQSFTSVKGDEGTYRAMIESLAFDRDLEFSAPDIARVESASEVGSKYLILHRVDERFFYSKPAVYPVLAAPLYFVAGPAGPFLFNFLALAASLWIAWRYLERFGRGAAALALTTFAGTGVLLAYGAWAMGDALQVACALAGASLCLGSIRRGGGGDAGFARRIHPALTSRLAPWAGGALLGLLAAARITNLIVAAAVIGALLVSRRWRLAAAAGLALAAALAASLVVNDRLLSTPRPYKAVRATFDPGSGYPGGSASQPSSQALSRFERSLSTVRIPTQIRPRVSLYATFYFLVGRHSGVLVYLPAALVFLLASLRRPDRIGLALLAGVFALAAVYLLWLPHNYFGGGAMVGNRYFLTAYPLLLLAPRRLPRARWQFTAWLVAALAFVSSLVSVDRVQAMAPSSQSHAQAGLFRLLPYESVASDLEGNAERFWLEEWELVRFADPYARVADWSFDLDTESQPAEIEIANTRADGLMRFLVLSSAEEIELVYEDWNQREVFPLTKPMGSRGVVEIRASKPWRVHPLWFAWMRNTDFHARVFRLSVRTPDGSPASARLSYLGPGDLDLDIFEREVLEARGPRSAQPGESSEVAVRVRNLSSETWSSERVLPVYLSYRLTSLDEAAASIEGPRTTIEAVEPNEVLEAALEIAWPERAATYRLEVDLLVEGVAWFGRRTGGPLLASEVTVGEPVAAGE